MRGGNYEADREKFRRKMIFSDFIEKVRTSGVTNDFYITASNNSANKDALPELWDDIVQIPEYLNGKSLQNGFFWFGPAGTITPFHHDLTNNFMAQVIGRKRILLAAVVGHAADEKPFSRLLRDRRTCHAAGSPSAASGSRRSSSASSTRARSSSCPSAACTSSRRSRSRRPCPSPTSPSTTTTTRASTRPITTSERLAFRKR